MHAPPPQAGPTAHDLNQAWNEMRQAGAAPARMHAPSAGGGWSAEFDGAAAAQMARPQQGMPMQSNCEPVVLPLPRCPWAAY